MWHDDEERKVVASGMKERLQEYAERLDLDQLIFSEDYNSIVSVDDVWITFSIVILPTTSRTKV